MSDQYDIELSSCEKHYGRLHVLKDVSLKVKRGEFITVLGPSGCGKTTTLRAIGGFITLDSGQISVRGRNVTALPPYQRNIGVVFQNYALWPHMTVFENLAFGLRIRKLARDDIAARVDRALEMVQLSGLNGRYPGELSGGQQQRVAMARALAIDPEVILLDEPLSNLDRRLREELRIELKRLQRSLGVTMLFVTHDQEEALSMSDRVVVMNAGSIQQVADPRTVYERPANSFVAGFLGSANFLAAEVINAPAGEMGRVKLADDASIDAFSPTQLDAGESVRLIVRPEWMKLDRDGSGENHNRLNGVVDETIYEGSSVRYGIRLDRDPDTLVYLQERSNVAVFNAGEKVKINVTDAVIAHD